MLPATKLFLSNSGHQVKRFRASGVLNAATFLSTAFVDWRRLANKVFPRSDAIPKRSTTGNCKDRPVSGPTNIKIPRFQLTRRHALPFVRSLGRQTDLFGLSLSRKPGATRTGAGKLRMHIMDPPRTQTKQASHSHKIAMPKHCLAHTFSVM